MTEEFFKLVFHHSSFRSTALELKPSWPKRVQRIPLCGVLGNVKNSQLNKFFELKVKNDRNELIYETETDSQTSKTNLRSPKRKGGGKDKLVGACD